jgi:phosphoadenosine phosphosulfate reductase
LPLLETTLFGIEDKVAIAIERLKCHEPPEGYHFADSGGKDSTVVRDLLIRSGCKYDGHYSATTVDPPEVIYFIRKHHPETVRHQPEESMWQLVVKHSSPPTRIIRYCCKELKEVRGSGRLVVTGIRWAESVRRKRRSMVEACYQDTTRTYLHPIIDWSNEDVWEYIRTRNLPYCSLYDEGYKRVGCIMCPMSGHNGMLRDAKRWPKIAEAWRRAIYKAYDKRVARGDMLTFATAEEFYQWWLSRKGVGKPTPVLFE